MSIRKLSLFFILTLLGVMFIAPSASAEDYSDIVSDICQHYNLDEDTCYYVATSSSWGTTTNLRTVCVYPIGTTPNIRLNSDTYGTNAERGLQFQFANGYGYSEIAQSYTTNGFPMWGANYSNERVIPFTFEGSYPVDDLSSIFTWNNNRLNLTLEEAINYNQATNPLLNVKFTNPDTMLIGYLHTHGYVPVSAYLADSNYSKIEDLNIVTSLHDLGEEYTGMYCLRKDYDKILTFEVARTPDYTPTQTQLNAYLIVEFDVPSNTEWSSYFGYSYSDSPHRIAYSSNNAPFTSFDRAYPMGVPPLAFYGVEISGSSNEPTSDMSIKYAIHWYNMSLSAIPHPQTSPLYISFNYTLTENGTITDGKGSTSYEDYETQYIQNNYNIAMGGLTGNITGRTSFSGSWTGESPDTIIQYDDTMTYDDAGLGNFFQRIFTVGNGYFTTLLLSVFAVAFAAYIIYGRS